MAGIMDRRAFIRRAGAAAGLALLPGAVPGIARAMPRRRFGIALYSVMLSLDRDFAGTLRTVRDIGYREVETLGAFNRDPAEVRRILDSLGLVTPSQHLQPGNLYGVFSDFNAGKITQQEALAQYYGVFNFQRVDEIIGEAIERGKIMGQRYIVWQGSWPKGAGTDAVDGFVKAFTRAGELCARADMQFCFHNHDQEFVPVGTDIPFDLIMRNTSPALVKLELDIGNITMTNRAIDPVAYLERYAGRIRLVHLKDLDGAGKVTALGSGVLDLPRIIATVERIGVDHAYYEYDQPKDPIAEAQAAYSYLRRHW